jgi:hypothetical protein
MRFVHAFTKDRPGSPPGVTSVPYPADSEAARRATLHILDFGAFAASALVVSGLLAEAIRMSARKGARKGDAKGERGRKKAQCLGHYIAAIKRGEDPPTASELARKVGCHRATASKAIKDQPAIQKELAKRAAREKYRG